eukprot:GHVL01042183.1.p1 GENE.GHVL01042183.1~~GHVL01042183.1.p1  ORF type:complete len:155 (+),score=7.22 GHVL01042183.1:39-503(+)
MSNKNVISPPGHYPATQVAPIGNPYYHNKSFSASQPSAQTYGHPVNSSGHNSTNTQPNFNNNGEYKQSYPYLSSQQTVHPHQSYGQFICTNDPTCITMDLPLQIRHRFIQKVFLILALQLVVISISVYIQSLTVNIWYCSFISFLHPSPKLGAG